MGGVGRDGEESLARCRAAQRFANMFVAQQARHLGERLQMRRRRVDRGEQHENEVDRLIVHRLESDRVVEL